METKFEFKFSDTKPYALLLNSEEGAALLKRLYGQEKMDDHEKQLCKHLYAELFHVFGTVSPLA